MVRAVTCRHSIQNVRRAPRRSNASSESASEDTSWRKMEIGARLTWNQPLSRNPDLLHPATRAMEIRASCAFVDCCTVHFISSSEWAPLPKKMNDRS